MLHGPLAGDAGEERAAVDIAVASNDVEIVRILLANHFSLDRPGGTPPLAIAAGNGPSRAAPLLPYFESGFPHGRHQFISFAGTAAASLALLIAV